MNALAATFRRRRPEADQLEDLPAEEGLQIIGQELVPVIPLTPSAEGGDAQSRAGGDQQLAILPGGEGPCRQGGEVLAPGRPGGDQHLAVQLRGDGPCQYGGEVLAHGRPGGNDSELREGDRAQTMLVAVSPGIPNGGDMPEDLAQEGQSRALRTEGMVGGFVPTTPMSSADFRREGAWPGGPTMMVPRSYGPMMSTPDGAPLFDYMQLKRFQELYEAAPAIYGQTTEVDTERPEFLREEEELQRRLAELQAKKRRAKEEQEQRIARAMQEKAQREMMENQRSGDFAENEVIRMMMMENQRMKEEIQELKKGSHGEKASPIVEEFKTPEEKGDPTLWDDVVRKLKMEEEGRHRAGVQPSRGIEGAGHGAYRNASAGDPVGSDTMKFMMTMLESMQQLIKERDAGKGGGDAEIVKSTTELPKLPEWNHETGPIDLGDWIATIDPFMEDLSDSAEVWWKILRGEAMAWYEDHMAMSPLDRLTHEVKPSTELAKSKWTRLERRAAGLLMAAIPTSIREEVVSTRSVTVMGILTRLFTVYQPGGLAEKALILSSLENPKEESTIAGAVVSLRRWIRWRRRAGDVGVSIPDPTVLMRGLTRLTKKVMNSHPELAFRVSLARNTLLVDSIPNHKTVSQMADHILAELEQVQHQDRKQRDAAGGDPAKLKEVKSGDAMEAGGKAKGKGKDKSGGKGEKGADSSSPTEPRCKFYLTDAGCRKGRDCGWAHVSDGKRRCYGCGATDHLAPDCPRKSSSSATPSPPRPKAAKATDDKAKEEEQSVSSEGTSVNGGEVMQQLLTEANKMLKTLSSKEKPATVTHDERMRALQEQLDELKEKTLRTLRLTRITRGGVSGLLDSTCDASDEGSQQERALRQLQGSRGDVGEWEDRTHEDVA